MKRAKCLAPSDIKFVASDLMRERTIVRWDEKLQNTLAFRSDHISQEISIVNDAMAFVEVFPSLTMSVQQSLTRSILTHSMGLISSAQANLWSRCVLSMCNENWTVGAQPFPIYCIPDKVYSWATPLELVGCLLPILNDQQRYELTFRRDHSGGRRNCMPAFNKKNQPVSKSFSTV